MKKYLITVYAGTQENNDGTVYKTFIDNEKAALDSFKEQLDFEMKTLDQYTCKYVAVALESFELDDEQEELIDTFTTIKYVELKK
jgi:hypothetical protein